ncbi:2,3-bisphosphoglycerate-independent phosphoglycerate mutase [Roseomonas genomospecies 6]|uniref:2,3-bisphosphoglycerate-independent phosphoglycerate mutase n=1 Tax=Roseomonas genomospecies 6 TaxID=214106 RepID=A0A9W7NL52_9PROT|nr:2,3-bisphosphoglycerate-independent phosphoglycerate mutase [Roseomonas genomospecies 6]KAA0681940.1 2,3-bisphosphoglycerate-independent phosphoglycerate mutase [Roseomonas genomospecies 6]
MTETNRPRPVVLCILDGWGYREEREDNAIAQGDTPNWDRLWSSEPRAFLEASEEEVGLPKGQMGNSEVGHMNLGAGRVVRQDLVMIDHAIVEGELERNAALNDLAKALRASGGRCHILGLLSPGGVHSHQDHIAALAGVLAHEGVPVEIHAFTDGRDVPPQSAKDQMAEFMADVHALPGVTVATVSGRYYAMDRDKRWDRVAKAYAALVSAQGEKAADPIQAIEQSYAAGTHDEFILPTVIDGYTGMKDGDAILMANFRADRAREILAAFVDPAFDGFERASVPKLAAVVGMVEYSSTLAKLMTTIFPPKSLTKVLGEVVSEAGLTQLRIAETEKYPHVTFFFNGGEERVYPGEDRILVPSPKVATYDLQPEMSAAEMTDKVVAAVDSGTYDLIVINYANPDMVGHSGILSAAIKAVEAVDASLGRLEAAVRAQGGVMLVTADHGNCELMKDPETNGPHTAHTLDKVPLVLVNGPAGVKAIRSGRLADIAPTLLDLMKLPQPAEMTGKSLIDRASARAAAE